MRLRQLEWGQKDLARVLKVSKQQVSLWCKGRIPKPETMEAIAAALKIEADWLMGFSARSDSADAITPEECDLLERLRDHAGRLAAQLRDAQELASTYEERLLARSRWRPAAARP